MTTFMTHSIENPPQPCTWRIRREEHDVWVDMWCPNGHKMKMQARIDFGLLPLLPMNIAYRCVSCGFGDMVWLISSKDPYGLPEVHSIPENANVVVRTIFTGFHEVWNHPQQKKDDINPKVYLWILMIAPFLLGLIVGYFIWGVF